jgi:hypothetical protein
MGLLDGSVAFAREWRERRERARMTADSRVAMRLAAKAKLADALAPLYRGDVDAEVIVRDADRDDGYPQPDDKFRLWRLSPWFKAELVKPWGDGISVLHGYQHAIVGDGQVRIVDRNEGREMVQVVGRIPYEVISGVDPDGDVDYPMPQIFCHFDFNWAREPYREVVAYRDHGEGRWFALEGMPVVGLSRYSAWSRWRLHRQIEKYQQEVEREHPRVPPSPKPPAGE